MNISVLGHKENHTTITIIAYGRIWKVFKGKKSKIKDLSQYSIGQLANGRIKGWRKKNNLKISYNFDKIR